MGIGGFIPFPYPTFVTGAEAWIAVPVILLLATAVAVGLAYRRSVRTSVKEHEFPEEHLPKAA